MTAWPEHLAGACYTRADGWFWPLRQEDGTIRREPIPAAEIAAAGLAEHPEMKAWQTMLVLQARPIENRLQRC